MTNTFRNIEQFYFIWNADWSISGAINAAKDFVSGVESCSLCEIAYSGVKQKPEWKECQASIPVPIEVMYRNKVPTYLENVISGSFPVVIAKTTNSYIEVLNKDEIESCSGSVDRFKSLLVKKVDLLTLQENP